MTYVSQWLLIGAGIALVSFLVFVAKRISAKDRSGAVELGPQKIAHAEIPQVPILFETNKTGSLYRAGTNAYLMLHVLITNGGSKAVVIRTIGATMGNEKGDMVYKKFTTMASYQGRYSDYTFGSSENLLPLSLAGNTHRDAYLCFEFPDANVETGSIALKVATSKGRLSTPLEVEVVG